jgi:Cdc6-like AAA superfamily ATPase
LIYVVVWTTIAEGGSITTTLSTGERSAVLLERQEALASLSAWLGEVTAERRGRLVFVCGEAGVGKTLMLHRFCDELAPGIARSVPRKAHSPCS